MLLFSSRDHLTLPGICLWVLITTIRLHCSHAFDILSHKTAAPSSFPSPSPSPSSFPSPSFSSPSSPSPFSSYSSSSSSSSSSFSSPKLNMLFPNKFYSRFHQLSANLRSPSLRSPTPPSFKTSIDAKSPSHSRRRIFKRAISRLLPRLPSSEDNLLSFTSGHVAGGVLQPPRNHLDDPWSTKIPIAMSSKSQKLRPPPQIMPTLSSIKEMQNSKSYFKQVDQMKSLKSALRRRMKEKSILKAKMLEAASLKKDRLSKMESVEAIALAKSPPKTQILRSIKARRGDYRVHNHHAHSRGRHGSGNIDLSSSSSGSFGGAFGGGDGLVRPQNAGVFPGGFELDADGFVVGHHLPKDAQTDFVMNNGDGFLSSPSSSFSSSSSSSSSGFLPQPLPPPPSPASSSSLLSSSSSSFASSPSSSSSSSSSSSHHHHNQFGHFPSQQPINHNSFGDFLGASQQPSDSWQVFAPLDQQPQPQQRHDGGFGFFAPSAIMPSSMPNQEGGGGGGVFFLPSSDDAFPVSSSWGQELQPSSFSNVNHGFADGFESFPKEDRDCPTISTTICRSSRDCQCNGAYTCMGSRCVRKGPSGGDDNDPIGGVWHEAPAFEPILAQTRNVQDQD